MALSLPVRERGLKYLQPAERKRNPPSLPVRERGLKYDAEKEHFRRPKSLPVREHGLKYFRGVVATLTEEVAPCAGAWVEIIYVQFLRILAIRRSLCGSVG